MKYNINAVYVKELKQSVRSVKFPVSVALYCFSLAMIGIFTLVSFSALGNPAYSSYSIRQAFIMLSSLLFGLEFALIVFVVPAITGGLISGERDHGTLDMLLATALSPFRIISGKLFAAISKLILYVVSSLPVLALVFTIGGSSIGGLGRYILLIITVSVYIGSFGILMSVVFRKTNTSIAAAYLVVMFLVLGTAFIAFISSTFSEKEYLRDALKLLLLFNPIETLLSLFDTQAGLSEITSIYFRLSDNTGIVTENWFETSIAVQIATSVLNIFLAKHFLNPFRTKTRRGGS